MSYNTAKAWSVLYCLNSRIIIEQSTFYKNNAGVIFVSNGNVFLESTRITKNTANTNRGLIYLGKSTVQSSKELLLSGNYASDATIIYLHRSECNFTGRFKFSNNIGSFLIINSLVTFQGVTSFLDCSQPVDIFPNIERGGAVTTIESTMYFIGNTNFVGNNATMAGGAIHATGSTLHMSGHTTIANNFANDSGGGVYLYQSKLNCVYKCTFTENRANSADGAIYAIASTVYANDVQRGIWTQSLCSKSRLDNFSDIELPDIDPLTVIMFKNNSAIIGGALLFKSNSKLYGNTHLIMFEYNCAHYGGAIYVDDLTTSSMCASKSFYTHSAATDCFIQMLNYQGNKRSNNGQIHYKFIGNNAEISGPSLYGGLLDRCTESIPINVVPVSLRVTSITHITPSMRVKRDIGHDIMDIDVALISSDPVRVCFCVDDVPMCEYELPAITVKKGHIFGVSLVAVDQVEHMVNATIHSSLSSQAGGLGEGQQSQSSHEMCTNLTFNAYSPLGSEILTFYAEGPCNNTGISKRQLNIHFALCTCPLGFQPKETLNTRCDCICDIQLYPYITECNSTTELLLREDTVWIGYHTKANDSGYLIYRYCPYDYCYPPTLVVEINLNILNGTDAQCAFNRSGLLCGACKHGYSLSLGSSHCIQCPKLWPGLMVAIILLGILAGIILVAIILILNLTVATGTVNGIIFYVNIIVANFSTYMPLSHQNVITVSIVWLNLDFGIDTCFYNGMDAYAKQWLQLAFPTYLIVLVAVVIFISERSSRFARLIGRSNPVAALAMLILLSYTKFLRAIIDIFSFAVLKYPDGSSKIVWLLDATVPYLTGKHIPLFMAALTILALGITYTLLLFTWQWLLKLPTRTIFQWIRNTRLNSFMDAYLAPHTSRHRYWTGLLLFVRVLLYLVSALNLSNNPRVILLAVSITISCLFLLKAVLMIKIYRQLSVELLEVSSYFNLLLLSLASFYLLGDQQSQTVVAYTSIGTALVLFSGIILYHILCTASKTKCINILRGKVRKRRHLFNTSINLLNDEDQHTEVTVPTSTVIEIRMSPQHSTQYSCADQLTEMQTNLQDRMEGDNISNKERKASNVANITETT